MAKKALYILSEYGYWGVELLGPLTHLDAAGYEAVFATPKGKRAHALPPSYDPTYFIKGKNASICAACPEAQTVAPRPPSKAAKRSSKAATVGLVSRE